MKPYDVALFVFSGFDEGFDKLMFVLLKERHDDVKCLRFALFRVERRLVLFLNGLLLVGVNYLMNMACVWRL